MLAVNVTVGVADVDFAKLHEKVDARTVGVPKCRITALSIAHIAQEQRSTKIVGGVLQHLQKFAMTGRHVVLTCPL